jgi:cytochrome c-type biogenesis protein CcmH
MLTFLTLAAIVFAAVVLGLLGYLFFTRRNAQADVAAELRELLLARAQGSIAGEEFERRQAALHARLVESPRAASGSVRRHLLWALPACFAAVAGALYGHFGAAPEGAGSAPPPPAAAAPASNPQANSGGDLNVMLKRLADKMAKDPGNGDGWLLLARTYGELRRFPEAADAYAKADALLAPDAALLADWADAHVMARDRNWDDKARGIVKKALAADPKHAKSLALAGSEAFQRADYKAAIGFWKRMQAVAPPDSMDARLAETSIAEATALMKDGKPQAAQRERAPVATEGIAGTVVLDAKLKAEVSSADTVFVVAKAPDGKGFPLAVKRFAASELPARFSLGDGDAMMPGRTLSKFGEVLLSARVSKTGSATPQPGDIGSESVRTNAGTAGVRLELRAKL